jgi:glycosyltransferase involved in cell wall biosynthesis
VKVLFVYKFLTLGGVETVLQARLEGLSAHRLDAQAWFLRDGGGRSIFDGLEARIQVGDVGALRSYLEGQPPDVVSSIDTEEVFPLISPAAEGPKLVVEAHSPYVENLEYLRRIDRANVAAFFVPTEHQRAVVLRRLGNGADVTVIPNALRRCFVERDGALLPKPPRPIVAWVGRLDALKNWVGFLAIARRVARRMPEVEFWMVTPSPGSTAAGDLYRRVSRLGLAERFVWYQGLPHDRMPNLLDAVRESGGVVLSTSLGESFGMAIAEAMARGCAVVVPRHSAFPELVEDGRRGRLYRAGSGSDAARCVGSFLEDVALRNACGSSARASVVAKHSAATALPVLVHALTRVANPL